MAYHPDRQLAKKQIEQMSFPSKPLRSVAQFLRLPSQGNQYIGMENVESDSGQLLETGVSEEMAGGVGFLEKNILFPKLRPYLNKVWLSSFSGNASTEFHILKPSIEISPEFLAIFLRSSFVLRQTSRLMTGSTLPRLQTDEVKRLLIPIPDKKVQQKIISDWNQAVKQVAKAEQKASDLLAGIDDYLC